MNIFRKSAILTFTAMSILAGTPCFAQKNLNVPNVGTKNPLATNSSMLVNPKDVGLDQFLDAQVPLDASFLDESGKAVKIGDYLGKKPVLLNMIFYKCQGVCMRELEGIVSLLRDQQMSLTPGKDFEIVTVSINPKETPADASIKKLEYIDLLKRPELSAGWHFLTGADPEIKRLAASVGFRYSYNPKTDQFAHPAGIILLTPQGKISRYFMQTVYPAKDVRLGMVEAGSGKIGSLTDKFVLNCIYQYDPTSGRYGLAIIKLLRLCGGLTVAILAGSILLMSMRSGRKAESIVVAPDSSHGAAQP
ncbi:MAG: SCO family protein [Chthonomonadales bacterium]